MGRNIEHCGPSSQTQTTTSSSIQLRQRFSCHELPPECGLRIYFADTFYIFFRIFLTQYGRQSLLQAEFLNDFGLQQKMDDKRLLKEKKQIF